ncbi:hypothetical protein F2Q70_00042364 [Brassica cretica]|uniref:Uncharacterized protein n=1 Tax=Brassica cretica TaxID=69181 RepID=A0A8S9KJN7_BRACR|nr:hypothetical protein F2Q70_00042364 [Brassica cretica]
MPNSYRSNKDKHLLFSEDPAHLEHTIRKDQRSTSIDAAAFTSTDSGTQPSTDTRPSSPTDLHRLTSIDTTPRTSIDPRSRNMVAIVILRQEENGNLYDQDGHLRNATGQKLDGQGNVIPDTDATGAAQPVEEASRPRTLADYNNPDEYYSNRSAIRLPENHIPNFKLKPQYYMLMAQIPYSGLSHEHPMDHLDRHNENGNLYDQDGHLRNATGQKLDGQGNVIPDTDATGAAQPSCSIGRLPVLRSIDNKPSESDDSQSSESIDLKFSASVDTLRLSEQPETEKSKSGGRNKNRKKKKKRNADADSLSVVPLQCQAGSLEYRVRCRGGSESFTKGLEARKGERGRKRPYEGATSSIDRGEAPAVGREGATRGSVESDRSEAAPEDRPRKKKKKKFVEAEPRPSDAETGLVEVVAGGDVSVETPPEEREVSARGSDPVTGERSIPDPSAKKGSRSEGSTARRKKIEFPDRVEFSYNETTPLILNPLRAEHKKANEKAAEEKEILRVRFEELEGKLKSSSVARKELVREKSHLEQTAANLEKEKTELVEERDAAVDKLIKERQRLRDSRGLEVTRERERVEAAMAEKASRRFDRVRDHFTRLKAFEKAKNLYGQASGTKKCLEVIKASGTEISQEMIDVFAEQEKLYEAEVFFDGVEFLLLREGFCYRAFSL